MPNKFIQETLPQVWTWENDATDGNCLTCIHGDKGSNLQWLYRIIFSLMQNPHPRSSLYIIIAIRPLSASWQDCLWNCNEPLSHSCFQNWKIKLRNDSICSREELWVYLRERTIQCQETLQLSLRIKLSWVDSRETNNHSNVNTYYILRVF